MHEPVNDHSRVIPDMSPSENLRLRLAAIVESSDHAEKLFGYSDAIASSTTKRVV
jgi:hypothetical protein